MTRASKPARRAEPLSEAEFLARCDCRCPRMRGTHPAGMCGSDQKPATERKQGR